MLTSCITLNCVFASYLSLCLHSKLATRTGLHLPQYDDYPGSCCCLHLCSPNDTCCLHALCSDIGLHVGKNFVESFPERVYVSQVFPLLVEAKRLGEKSGSGFYKFDARRRASPDPSLEQLIRTSIGKAGLLGKVFGGKPPKLLQQEIIEFLFFPVVNEGCRVVAEGIMDKAADLDVATVMAMGFPPYR
eukprot:GHRR01033692.1.p1 GENE.GHRR01033692.1~~GHRR01033692.1.p1  ORF type:complete len:189 (-),score=39.02 GHRR01033692.1:116-682(-)